MQTLIKGGIGGLVGTLTMSAVMAVAKAMGQLGEAPPKRITKNAERKAGGEPSKAPKETVTASWIAAHFGFGAAAGVIFALLRRFLPLPFPVAGLLYGITLWAFSYKKLMPALGLYPPPEWESSSQVGTMIAAHVVYGLTLAPFAGRKD